MIMLPGGNIVYNLHVIAHIFVGCICTTVRYEYRDAARPLTTAGWDLDDLDRDLSYVYI